MKEGLFTLPEEVVVLIKQVKRGKDVPVRQLPLRIIPESEIPSLKGSLKGLMRYKEEGNLEMAFHDGFWLGKKRQYYVSYMMLLRESQRYQKYLEDRR